MQAKFFPMAGGMDQVTPPIAVPAGRLASCLNYEGSPRGYRRIDGWERFDGRPRPSEATYDVVPFEGGAYELVAGMALTGEASGKTAKVIAPAVVTAGNFGTFDAAGVVPVVGNGGLLNGETLFVGAIRFGQVSGEITPVSPPSLETERAWMLAAQNERRALIGAVPGSGPVRGVWTYKGAVYAIRDNATGTAGVLHVALPSGWAAVPLFKSVAFDGGTAAFEVGQTVTTTVPAGTGTVKKVVVQDGAWSTSDAKGRLILSDTTGTFGDNRPITSPTGAAVIDGTLSDISLPPGGRYTFDNHNFLATTGTLSMYAAGGVGPAFEFDGTTLTPILTGEADDQPIRVIVHRDHLFLAYRDGRLIHSSTFNPLNFEVVQGALAGGMGDEITDLCQTATGDLAVFTRHKVAVLYGTNTQNWNLVMLTDESGAEPWTAQLLGAPLYLDKIGIRALDTTQAYGNFALGTRTQLVQKFFETKRRGNIPAVGSLRVRAKDSYRVFFADGEGVTIYFGRKMQECTVFDLGFPITCSCSGTNADGTEILLVGKADGMVCQLDKGTSADGAPIAAHMRLPFNHVGSPAQEKRWHRAALEIDGSSQTRLRVTTSISYGDPDLPENYEQAVDVRGGGGLWNEAVWDTFYWSSPVEGQIQVYIDGLGYNLSLVIISDNDYDTPHTLTGVFLYYNYRRLAS